jgi:hypothetical protein
MVIKKVRRFIDKITKKPLKNKPLVIIGLGPKSTLIGRQKVISLKKIGRNKRDNK